MLLTLLQSILLFVNAIAILNQKRFLKKYGFDTSSAQPGSVNQTVSSKNQIIMMVFTLRSIGKYALIPLNLFAIMLQILG